jgi:hypothetical protein
VYGNIPHEFLVRAWRDKAPGRLRNPVLETPANRNACTGALYNGACGTRVERRKYDLDPSKKHSGDVLIFLQIHVMGLWRSW